jgi:predicted phage terminase large subunit-like protein
VNKKSDFSAFIVCGFDSNRILHVVEAYRDKLDAKDVVEKIFQLREQYRPRVVAIEANATQQVLTHWIKDQQTSRGTHFRITEVKNGPKQSKGDRIKALLPYFKGGRIAIPEEFDELYSELSCFPNLKHDDLLDALSFIEKVKLPEMSSYSNPNNKDAYFKDTKYTPFWMKRKE